MGQIRKIIIFGATGNTGKCCLQSAVDLGYDVTAFVRSPDKLPDGLVSQINVVVGDATNPSDVDNAVQGHDGIIMALGNGMDLSPTTMLSEGTKNALDAMARYGIQRISACMSAFLYRELDEVPEKFLEINADHQRMLDALKNSDREWIACLPPHIADIPATNNAVISHGEMGPSRVVSKYDLGKFLVEALESDEHVHKLCGICNPPE